MNLNASSSARGWSVLRLPSCILLICFAPAVAFAVEKFGTLAGDETWSGPIEISNSVTVPEGVTLTIDPGTVVKFGSTRRLSIDGTLIAVGTSGSPITFTSLKDDSIGGDTNGDGAATAPAANDWQYLELQGGNTADATLEHVNMRYGGSGGYAINVFSGAFSLADVSIRDFSGTGVRIASSASGAYALDRLTLERVGSFTSHYGVLVEGSNATVVATDLTSTDVSGSHVQVASIQNWQSSGSSFSGTGIKAIRIEGGTISDAKSWSDDVPYFLSNAVLVDTAGELTIPPGSIVLGDAPGLLRVRGKLVAEGGLGMEIKFGSIADDTIAGDTNGDADATSPAAGDWVGVEVQTGGTGSLRFAHFSHAGRSQGGTVRVTDGLLSLTDSKISDGNGDGVYALGGDVILARNVVERVQQHGFELLNDRGFATLTDNEIREAASGVYSFEAEVQMDASGTEASDCGLANGILVQGVGIQEFQEWREELPYYLKNSFAVSAGVLWRIAPGTVLKIGLAREVSIRGELEAIGTSEAPIIFTSYLDDSVGGDTNGDADATSPAAGDWRYLYATAGDTSLTLDWAVLKYGGDGSGDGSGILRVANEYEVRNTILDTSESTGLRIESAKGGVVSDTTIRNTLSHGVYVTRSDAVAPIDLTGNVIENVGDAAVRYWAISPVDLSGTTLGADPKTGYVELVGAQISGTTTLAGDTTYLVTSGFNDGGENLQVASSGSLTIEAGAILKFAKFKGVQVDGNLTINGVEGNPVVFTSYRDDAMGGDTNGDADATTPGAGDWFSLWYRDGSVVQQQRLATGDIKYLDIRYAGVEGFVGSGTGTPAILLDGGASISLSNVSIMDVADVGFRSRFEAVNAQVNDLRIEGTAIEAISLQGGTIDLDGVFIDDIGGDALALSLPDLDFTLANFEMGETVGRPVTFIEQGFAEFPVTLGHTKVVVLDGILRNSFGFNVDPSITVLPGTIIKVVPDTSTYIGDNFNGPLVLKGEPGNPIIITSFLDDTVGGDTNGDGAATSPAPGDWQGLVINSNEAILKHLEIRYAGKSFGKEAAIEYHATSNIKGARLESVRVSDSLGGAVYADDLDGFVVSNSIFERYDDAGIVFAFLGPGDILLSNNNFIGGTNAIIEPSFPTVYASNNVFLGHSEAAIKSTASTPKIVSRHNLYYSPNATEGDFLHSSIDNWEPADRTGDISSDPQFNDADAGDFDFAAGSPLIDAADGSRAPGRDARGFQRFDDLGILDTGSGRVSYADIGAYERLGSSDPSLNPDLAVDATSIQLLVNSVPLSLSQALAEGGLRPGDKAEVEFVVKNDGGGAALGNWIDAVYFSRDGTWDSRDILAGSAVRPNTLGIGEMYTQSFEITIPNLPDAGYRLIVRTDFQESQLEYQDSNNTASSGKSYNIEVTPLPLNQTTLATFPEADRKSVLYRIDASGIPGQDLKITVDANGAEATSELFAAMGMAPTSFSFEYENRAFDGELAEVQFNVGPGGEIYVLVSLEDAGAGFDNVSIRVDVLDFMIQRVRPMIAGNGGPVTLILDGAAFEEGDTVTLRHSDDGDLIEAERTLFRDSGTLTAPFLFSGDKLGKYDVIVTKAESSTEKVESFELVSLEPLPPAPRAEVLISSPDFLRTQPLAPTPLEVTISNPYSYDIPAMVLFEGSYDNGEMGGLYSTHPDREGTSQLVLLPPSEDGQPGMLAPGEMVKTQIYYKGIGNPDSTGEMIHQEVKSVSVDNSPANFDMMQNDSFYHSEFMSRVGETMESVHRAIAEEASRLKEMGIEETDGSVLLDCVYARITGLGDNSIAATITRPDGTRVGSTQVRLVDESSDGEVFLVTTNSQGGFSVENIPSGSYRVVADGFGVSSGSVVVHGGMALTDQSFVISEQSEPDQLDDATQYTHLTALQVEETCHLFLVRRGVVMHTYYADGAWQTARIVGNGTSPKPLYSATMVDGQPAIACFIEQAAGRSDEDPSATVDPNDIRIMVAIAKPDGEGGWIWYEPVEYAAHPDIAYTGFDVVLDEAGVPVVVWLGYDITNQEEDSDLYFFRRLLDEDDVGPAVAQFAPVALAPEISSDDFFYFDEKPDDYLYFAEPGDVFYPHSDLCKNFKRAFANDFTLIEMKGDKQPAIIRRLFGSNQLSISGGYGGEANLREGKASGRLDLDLKFLYDKATGEGIFATGQGRVDFAWKMNRETCKYEFKETTASAAVRVRSRVPLPNLSFSLGPVADVAVGIQIDGIFSGNFKWEQVELLPTFGSFALETGVGGYAVGTAAGGALSLDGSLTGNLKIEANRDGVNLKDIFIKGSVSGKVGPWKRTHEFKYSFLDTAAVEEDELLQLFAEGPAYSKTYTTAEGWEVMETGVRELKTGTASDYSQVGIANSVLSSVGTDTIDQSRPALFAGGGVWINEDATDLSDFGNSLIYAEFDGANWGAPVEIPGITGANREVQVIRDAQDRLLVVFAHADMSGLDGDSTDAAAFTAYEQADVCFLLQTESDWTAPQLVSSVPGTATTLRLHRLADGSVYLTWIEANGMETELYSQKWDATAGIWLAKRLLSSEPISSTIAMCEIGGNPTIIWAQLVASEEGAADFLGGSVLYQTTLVSGNWSVPAMFELSFDDFYPEVSEADIGEPEVASEGPKPQVLDLAIFNLNNYVVAAAACCDEEPEDVPELEVPEIDLPDSRQWPTTVGSFDPNDKFGANGHGPEGYIPAGLEIPYTVLFENDPDEGATAPALRVTVTDMLDPDFNYDTFRFVDFGWGELRIDAPENSQGFETIVDYQNADGSPLQVKVNASFDTDTGEIRFVFDSIDPDTGTTPLGAFDGFLQVEEGDGNGEGFFTYRVAQKTDLPDGTEFRNIANIVFDLNDPILTPEAVHTIDTNRPASSVSSPATSASSSFMVTLSGEDDGSGIAYYNVYRSVNNGAWALWRGGVTSDSIEFSGTPGNRYSFYSVATDWVGLAEEKAQAAETSTFIEASGIRVIEMSVVDNQTIVLMVTMPDEYAANLVVEESPLIATHVWGEIETVLVEGIDSGLYRITITQEIGEGLFLRVGSE